MGLFGPPNVEKLKAGKNIKGLVKALSYQEDWTVREAAAEALGKIGDACAMEPLITVLEKRNVASYVRRSAAQTLVRLYTSGSLDDHQMQTILALRSTIVGTSRRHKDGNWGCASMHRDEPAIKVEFPL